VEIARFINRVPRDEEMYKIDDNLSDKLGSDCLICRKSVVKYAPKIVYHTAGNCGASYCAYCLQNAFLSANEAKCRKCMKDVNEEDLLILKGYLL